nr:MAG TPA: hypothetical protein [Caudoviricetes sp.]
MCKEYPLCKNAYYEKQENGFTVLKCKERNGLCLYSRYCSTLLKVIHTSAYEQCKDMNK